MINWIINAFMNFVEFIMNAIRWLGDHYIVTIIIIVVGLLLGIVLTKIIRK